MAKSVAIILLVGVYMASPVWGQAPKRSMVFPSPFAEWMFLDLAQLNMSLQAQEYPLLPNAPLRTWGNIVTLSFIPQWYFGMSGGQGTLSAQKEDKVTRLFLGWTGVFAEYDLSIYMRASQQLSIGLVAGGPSTKGAS